MMTHSAKEITFIEESGCNLLLKENKIGRSRFLEVYMAKTIPIGMLVLIGAYLCQFADAQTEPAGNNKVETVLT